MSSINVLYDGWPLIDQPNSPAALHLLAILAHLPDAVQPVVALPDKPPAWLEGTPVHVHPMANTPVAHLRWEQHVLPRLVRKLGAALLHLTSSRVSLLDPANSVVSPCEFEFWDSDESDYRYSASKTLGQRLLESLGRGGFSRAHRAFWPSDLPTPTWPVDWISLPPVVNPDFTPGSGEGQQAGSDGSSRLQRELPGLDLPESYILYHGPAGSHHLHRLLQAWKWAAVGLGELYSLLIIGLDGASVKYLSEIAREYGLEDSLRVLPPLSPASLALLYQGCAALFHPAPVAPWGGPERLALACGVPVVASENVLSDALFGPAAYLAPAGDARALGAALITVVVEDTVAEKLSQVARQRAGAWQSQDFGQMLAEAYRRFLK